MDRITEIQQQARAGGSHERPRWPMIVLRTPKGWTGPREVDGKPAEGNWRSHQVPFTKVRGSKDHLKLLDDWLRSYRPEELFDETGAPVEEIRALAPVGRAAHERQPARQRRPAPARPAHADFRDYAVEVKKPGTGAVESTRVLGGFLRDVMARNADAANFRVFSPDENNSNRLQDLLEVTQRAWNAETLDTDDGLAQGGRVMEILSEHTCQGWLEGYLLTGGTASSPATRPSSTSSTRCSTSTRSG
jgi:xylulose-5-phosphate/fructose-6-phosphate phosphoketolase